MHLEDALKVTENFHRYTAETRRDAMLALRDAVYEAQLHYRLLVNGLEGLQKLSPGNSTDAVGTYPAMYADPDGKFLRASEVFQLTQDKALTSLANAKYLACAAFASWPAADWDVKLAGFITLEAAVGYLRAQRQAPGVGLTGYVYENTPVNVKLLTEMRVHSREMALVHGECTANGWVFWSRLRGWGVEAP